MDDYLNTVTDKYTEFLNELALQRHTIIKDLLNTGTRFSGYTAVKSQADQQLELIDALIRDTLKHIEVIGLVGVPRLYTPDAANKPPTRPTNKRTGDT